ncbi:hypothetical protein [Rhabdaerophilum calidifontis]|uniref:hypothetical protein n=1 Tax=Rhabdaerophilum calidifontis TaxID=2604328 RepID=UPI00197F6C19|nr:hypothetical protein [Rhabdaerophilum calidifontis]
MNTRSTPESPGARRRDPLFALLLGNALWGGALGLAFVAGVLALDLGHLRRLIGFDAEGLLALALLAGGSIVTFASVAMGGAIMMIEPRDPPAAGRRRLTQLVPAPLGAVRRARRADKARR